MAFELFGLRLFETQAERDAAAVIGDPQPYQVEIVTGSEGALDAAIRGASTLLADQDTPASGRAGLIAKARGDYQRIMGALYGEGHYAGAISIRIGGIEAARLAADADLPDPVAIRIVVDPGPVFRLGELRDRQPPAAGGRSGRPGGGSGGDRVRCRRDRPIAARGAGRGTAARSVAAARPCQGGDFAP